MASAKKPHQEPYARHRPNLSKARSAQSNGTFQSYKPKAQKYSVLSGQVYREIEVQSHKKQGSNWVGALKTPAIVKNKRPNNNGARRLFDMAKAVIAREMRRVESDHFAGIPWRVAEHIWAEVEEM